MISSLNNILGRRPISLAVALWMVAALLVVGVAAALVLRDRAHDRFRADFEEVSTRLAVLLEKRFEVASQEMLLAAGFVRSTDPTVREWDDFVSSQGFLSASSSKFITLLRPVNRDDLDSFIARERALGLTDINPILVDPNAEKLAVLTRAAGSYSQPSAPGLNLRGFPGAASPLDLTARTGEPIFLIIPDGVRAQALAFASALGWDVEIGQALAILPVGREGEGDGHEGWIVVDMDISVPEAALSGVGVAIELSSASVGGLWAENGAILTGADQRGAAEITVERSFSTTLSDVTLRTWSVGEPDFGLWHIVQAAVIGLMAAILLGAAWWFTDRLRNIGRWQREAMTDPVTGLASRAGLRRALEREMSSEAGAPVLFMLDINRFKVINESLGHVVGDRLLRIVGERLRDEIGKAGTVGRFGGDEFVMLVSGIGDATEAEVVATRLLGRVVEPISIGDRVLNPSASLGIALGDGDERPTFDSLLRDADAAVYEAKRQGQSMRIFDRALRRRAVNRLAVEQSIREALVDDRLLVEYQPIVSVATGEIVGVEALVRMCGSDGEMVSPGLFLPTAEEAGLMPEIGRRVLSRALSDAARWNTLAPDRAPLTISVNLSESELADPRLLNEVAEGLRRNGLDPRQLMLELSEDALVEHLQSLMSIVERLSALGVGLSIDDFGTGRSSLGHLRLLSLVDEVKIDRTFVREVAESGPSQDIVSAVRYLAGSLSAQVVAEGVETWEQWAVLSRLGIDLIQGFLVARPSPSTTIDGWVRDRTRFCVEVEQQMSTIEVPSQRALP